MIARLLVSPPGFACSHSKSVHLPCNATVSGSWLLHVHLPCNATVSGSWLPHVHLPCNATVSGSWLPHVHVRHKTAQHIQESLKCDQANFSGGAGDKARRDRSHVHFK